MVTLSKIIEGLEMVDNIVDCYYNPEKDEIFLSNLRRYQETDIDMQYKILTDERLSQYIKFPNLTKVEELKCIKKWIKEVDESKYEKWVITLKDNNIPIGNISVNGIEKKHNYCNVGYVIMFDHWGNGILA